jgi:putative ABC transport system permease protein
MAPDRFQSALSGGRVVLSRYTARRLHVDPGDRLSLPTPGGPASFTVGGEVEDMLTYDSIYIDQSVYRRLWGDSNVDAFAIDLGPGAAPAAVAHDMRSMLGRSGIGASVLSRQQAVDGVVDVVRRLVALARALELMALVIAALAIANTMFTAVLNRRWELALGRLVGLTGWELGGTLLLEAGGLGVMGGIGAAILGTMIGFVLTKAMDVGFAWSIPFEMPWALAALAIGGGVVIAAAVSLPPIRLATRDSIVGALRHE